MNRLLTAAKSAHLMTPRSSRWADTSVCLTSGLFGKPYGRIARQANPEGGPGG